MDWVMEALSLSIPNPVLWRGRKGEGTLSPHIRRHGRDGRGGDPLWSPIQFSRRRRKRSDSYQQWADGKEIQLVSRLSIILDEFRPQPLSNRVNYYNVENQEKHRKSLVHTHIHIMEDIFYWFLMFNNVQRIFLHGSWVLFPTLPVLYYLRMEQNEA